MIRSRRSHFYIVFLASLAAAALFGGVAHAETSTGTAENSSTEAVDVTGSDSSNVNVSASNESTTTVGSSTDGTSSTPSITVTKSSTVDTASNSDGSSDTGSTQVQQNDQTATPTGSMGSGTTPTLQQSGSTASSGDDVSHQLPVNLAIGLKHQSDQPKLPPVQPNQDKNQSAPVSTSSNGAVNQIGGGGSTGGKGLGITLGLAGLNPARVLILTLALLMVIVSSFISFLRRSGYSHAPRSDDSLSVFPFTRNPRVEMQALPVLASPAFFVASDKQLINQWKGGEWV